jgi:hypothetical protein
MAAPRGKAFAKGQSGNPGGRPKTKAFTEALVRELHRKGPNDRTPNLEMLVWKLVQLGIAGDVAAIREIANRLEGTPVQAHEVSGPDGQAFTLRIVRPHGEPDGNSGPTS